MGRECYLKNESNDSFESSTILQRIAQGDKQAVKECIDRYGNLIWNIARKYTSNRTDAEDAVQEVFIDLWKNAARFDDTKSPEEAFIALVARRRMIDRVRKINCRPQIHYSSEIALLNFANNDHQKLYKLTDEKPAIKALSKLTLKQKQFINMAVFEGRSYPEIAEIVGIPLATVKSNIRRGFEKIRRSIKSPNSLPI